MDRQTIERRGPGSSRLAGWLACGVAFALAAGTADAARLGVLRIHSAQGQAMVADLAVFLDDERPDELSLEVVATECDGGRAPCPPLTISRLAGTSEIRPVWRVASEVPMEFAVADIWVKLSGPRNFQTRSYTINFDLPVALSERPEPAPLLAAKERQQGLAAAVSDTKGQKQAAGEARAAGMAEQSQEGADGVSAGNARIPEEVSALVARWAQAWTHKRIEEYLGCYAGEFVPADGVSRDAWEALRKRSIGVAEDIDVRTDRMRVIRQNGERVTVEFRQHYRSRTFRSVVVKHLVLENRGGGWLILEERVRQDG